MNRNEVINELLSIEHRNVAKKLRFIEGSTELISDKLLFASVSVLDDLSFEKNQEANKIIIVLSAILWSYKKVQTTGLKDFLIVVLSRIGLAPSSIMIDDRYDSDQNRFSPFHSYFSQLSVTAHQLRFEINVNDKRYLLTEFQHRIWHKIDSSKVLGISAPTSAGKSFIICLKTIDLLLKKKGDVVYIVPTLSLINQVTVDYRRSLKEHSIRDYEILNTFIDKESYKPRIYILTPEKAIAAFSQSKSPFRDLRLVVIDEIQNVERVANEDDQRAKTLYDLITEFRQNSRPDHVIISGPRIEKIGLLGTALLGSKSEEEEATNSPVGSLTYSILQKGKKKFFKQYSGITNPLSLEIQSNFEIPKAGIQYNDKTHQFIADLVSRMGTESKNIIFSPNPRQATDTALFLARQNPNAISLDKRLPSLVKYLEETVHKDFDLNKTLPAGIAYHHGKLPHHVRRVIEKAINEKIVNNVVCTTTLMQGVNLPSQNVFIRNPNLFLKKKNDAPPKLTDYEIANLRGRAGRLMKDFLGRTFVLEEEQFTGDANGNLFSETTKELKSGYGSTFNKFQSQIAVDLHTAALPNKNNIEYAFLITYIRQQILKYPNNFDKHLREVGIVLNERERADASMFITDLKIGADVCIKNRYWDPLVLNQLFLNSKNLSLPTSIDENNIAAKLVSLVSYLQSTVPYYSNKYFAIENSEHAQLLTSACVLAENWLKERPLSAILSSPYYNDSEKINKAIETLQNTISYGLPMLLQPLYDIISPQSSFLRFIELGAYHPITRRLIEYSIPRETAILLKNEYLTTIKPNENNIESLITDTLKRHYEKMPYWVQVQLEVLF